MNIVEFEYKSDGDPNTDKIPTCIVGELLPIDFIPFENSKREIEGSSMIEGSGRKIFIGFELADIEKLIKAYELYKKGEYTFGIGGYMESSQALKDYADMSISYLNKEVEGE